MKNLDNIEKSAFKKGQYVCYADGVWHIRKTGIFWLANHVKCKYLTVCETTLERVSMQIKKAVL